MLSLNLPFLKFKVDLPLLIAVVFIISLGLMMIYSTGINEGQPLYQTNFWRQFLFALVGLAIFFLVSKLGFKLFESLSTFLFIIINVLLVVTWILGIESHGAVRWVDFGFFRFQPTEFAKPILILFLVNFFGKHDIRRFSNIVLGTLFITPLILLTFIQPDLGNTLILASIAIIVYFLAGLPARYFVVLFMGALVFIPVFWGFLHGYQRQRIFTFLSPEADPTGAGYNSIQSLIAVGSGRLFGLGFGRGTQGHLNFLPEKHTDFIFANLAEELGFLGVMILLIAYFILVNRLLGLSETTKNNKAKVFIVSTAAFLGLQMFINIGMNIGLLPITGITLPLVSYGGSSLISILFTLGLVQSARSNWQLKSD